MRWCFSFCFLFLCCLSSAADLTLPKSAGGLPGDFITVQATTTGTVVKWVAIDQGLKVFPTQLLKDTRTAVVSSNTPGSFRLLAYTADASGPSDPAICTVTVLGAPTPPEPVPNPPTPSDPAPISAPGFRVLVVYDTATVSSLPEKQQQCLFSTDIRGYMASKCIRGVDMKTPEYRFYDQSTDATPDGQIWAEAMKRPRKQLPWLIISDGKTGYEGPLPVDTDKFMELLKKHGG